MASERDPVAHLQQRLAVAAEHPDEMRTALLTRRDDEALADAAAVDVALPLAGDVLTVKACFDVAGWITHAGSRVLADAPAATADAPMVTLLREAGAILIAQTNMTEFAYGALGLNSNYGTPVTPLSTDVPRVAGGSTSGGAVAVALGVADISLGSDTSGSIRIPAAFCGVAGFKPSQGRYPVGGLIPLAPSFDAPGIIAPSAVDCRRIDRAITSSRAAPVSMSTSSTAGEPATIAQLRFVIPEGLLDGDVDEVVRIAFERWIDRLRSAGATVDAIPMPCLVEAQMAARRGFAIAVEAYDWHRDLVAAHFDRYDVRVGPRVMLGANVLAADYVAAMRTMRECAAQYHADLHGIDAMLLPTIPVLPPAVADVDDMVDLDAYLEANTAVLRFTEYANRLDLPSISIAGDLDDRQMIGLMLTGRRGHDVDLLDVAVQVEELFNTAPTAAASPILDA